MILRCTNVSTIRDNTKYFWTFFCYVCEERYICAKHKRKSMPKGMYDRETAKRPRPKRSQLVVVRGKRNQIDRDKDIWFAVSEVAKGKSYREVAEELNKMNDNYNLSGEMVRLDVDAAMVEWKKENMSNIDAYIAKELLRIEKIERKVQEDYEKSKTLRPNEYAALMKRGMTVDEIDEMYETRQLGGDPRYVEVLLHLQQQRMRLLGIDKGVDVAQQTIVNYNFGNLSDEALAKMADSLQDTKFEEAVEAEMVEDGQ